MINICNIEGELFSWRAIDKNKVLMEELDTSIDDVIKQTNELESFGWFGQETYFGYETSNGGFFNLFGSKLKLKITDSETENELFSTDNENNLNRIMVLFRNMEQALDNPNVVDTIGYNVGIRLENEYGWISGIISNHKYEGLKLKLTISPKQSFTGHVRLYINDDISLNQMYPLTSGNKETIEFNLNN